MTSIVTTHYSYKRPPRKRKAVALDVPTVVQRTKPGNDDSPDHPEPAIVTTTSRKRAKLQRAVHPVDDDPEADAEVKAFFVRMVRRGGALPPRHL